MNHSKIIILISCLAILALGACKSKPARCPTGSKLSVTEESQNKVESCRDASDRLQGKQTLTFSNGKLGKEANYKDGKLHGQLTIWLKTGQMESRRTFANGKKHGLEETWSEKGQQLNQTNYKDDKKDGLETLWYPNGKKASHGAYVKGRPHGEWTLWHENGSVRSKVQYEKGKSVSAKQSDVPEALSKKVLSMDAKQINAIGQAIQVRLEKSPLKSEIAGFEMGSSPSGLYARLSFLGRAETRSLVERQILALGLAYELAQATPYVTSVEITEVKDRTLESKKSP